MRSKNSIARIRDINSILLSIWHKHSINSNNGENFWLKSSGIEEKLIHYNLQNHSLHCECFFGKSYFASFFAHILQHAHTKYFTKVCQCAFGYLLTTFCPSQITLKVLKLRRRPGNLTPGLWMMVVLRRVCSGSRGGCISVTGTKEGRN